MEIEVIEIQIMDDCDLAATLRLEDMGIVQVTVNHLFTLGSWRELSAAVEKSMQMMGLVESKSLDTPTTGGHTQ